MLPGSNYHPGQPMLESLLGALQRTSTHEEATKVTLNHILQVTETHLAAIAKREDLEGAEVLRATHHDRPDLAYRGLVVVQRRGAPEDDLLPSTTAWELVRRHREPVAVDVEVGQYAEPNGKVVDLETSLQALESDTFRRMKKRRATHFLALPVRLPPDQFRGMVTVEIGCTDAAGGTTDLWSGCRNELQAIVDLAALFLDRLPLSMQATENGPLPAAAPRMAHTLETLAAFAPMPSPLLLLGESGTGKTRLARWCHEQSQYNGGDFVVAELYQFPEDQARARLFGVEKGAFTGAIPRRGYIEEAEGGTLFIDEIGELTPALQLSLLRLVDEKRFQRMGDNCDREANLRIIACTNADLTKAVQEGRFRHDLWHRLSSLAVEIPPMRERIVEIPAWGARFLEEIHKRSGSQGTATLAADAARWLQQTPSDGNLRGIRALVERAYAFALSNAGDDEPIVVGVEEVQLAAEQSTRSLKNSMLESLRNAAEAFLMEQETRGEDDRLELDVLRGAFAGMVVRAALERTGDSREVARKLGLGARVKGGNHLDTFRRLTSRLEQLGQWVGTADDLWPRELPRRN